MPGDKGPAAVRKPPHNFQDFPDSFFRIFPTSLLDTSDDLEEKAVKEHDLEGCCRVAGGLGVQ